METDPLRNVVVTISGRVYGSLEEVLILASARSRDLLGKGGAGDLPCRGSRGVPLASPFPKKVR